MLAKVMWGNARAATASRSSFLDWGYRARYVEKSQGIADMNYFFC